MPPVVKNLLIINGLLYLASAVFAQRFGFDMNAAFGLHYFMSDQFGWWQLVTFMFLHGSLSHVFFNMFAVFMFGRVLEYSWGAKRFLIYYFVTGIGSGIIQLFALYFDVQPFIDGVDAYLNEQTTDNLQAFLNSYGAFSMESHALMRQFTESYNNIVNVNPAEAQSLARSFLFDYQKLFIDSHITVGASGAVFGLLLAFGMMFPNTVIMLLIPPIPIKAKYFVMIYGAIELVEGIYNSQYDNVAHWAHLGGMLFGFFLIRKWRNSLY